MSGSTNKIKLLEEKQTRAVWDEEAKAPERYENPHKARGRPVGYNTVVN